MTVVILISAQAEGCDCGGEEHCALSSSSLAVLVCPAQGWCFLWTPPQPGWCHLCSHSAVCSSWSLYTCPPAFPPPQWCSLQCSLCWPGAPHRYCVSSLSASFCHAAASPLSHGGTCWGGSCHCPSHCPSCWCSHPPPPSPWGWCQHRPPPAGCRGRCSRAPGATQTSSPQFLSPEVAESWTGTCPLPCGNPEG